MNHGFWLWLYNNAQTVQAAVAVLAFLGLLRYAHDTKQIRVATLDQGNAGRRPYFHPEDWKNPYQDGTYQGKEYYQFKNCGSGIALNIRWRFLDDNNAPLIPLGSCAVGQVKYLFAADDHWIEYHEIVRNKGIRLEYEDTAGLGYWTTIAIRQMADCTDYASVDTGSGPKKGFKSWLLNQKDVKDAWEEFKSA